MITLVITDFDDTLCQTESAAFDLENTVAARMGWKPMRRDVHLQSWGRPIEAAILERFPGIDVQRFMELMPDVHRQFIAEGRIDSITERNMATLVQLRSRGKQVAMLTSRTLNEVAHLLHPTHPLQSLVERVYHKESGQWTKPDPRVFDMVLREFGVAPSSAVYIGDTVSDGECATAAGLRFIASLESGLRTAADFSDVAVDHFVQDFTQIIEYID